LVLCVDGLIVWFVGWSVGRFVFGVVSWWDSGIVGSVEWSVDRRLCGLAFQFVGLSLWLLIGCLLALWNGGMFVWWVHCL
jgi:hypothetical protein